MRKTTATSAEEYTATNRLPKTPKLSMCPADDGVRAPAFQKFHPVGQALGEEAICGPRGDSFVDKLRELKP